ncbi:MAG TPA: hypothetical protein VJB94_01630 [Candidatus Nanoarchaeia archaeon]|nr:hypothetical protein [Candidatus Nanoarchaeia archaeon]
MMNKIIAFFKHAAEKPIVKWGSSIFVVAVLLTFWINYGDNLIYDTLNYNPLSIRGLNFNDGKLEFLIKNTYNDQKYTDLYIFPSESPNDYNITCLSIVPEPIDIKKRCEKTYLQQSFSNKGEWKFIFYITGIDNHSKPIKNICVKIKVDGSSLSKEKMKCYPS